MKRIDGDFSGVRLRIARQFHGLTLADLGEKVGVSQPYLWALEANEKTPTIGLAKALAETLRFDVPFFYEGETDEFRDDECNFRKRRTTPVGVRKRLLAFGTFFGQLVRYLDSTLGLPRVNFPLLHAESMDDVEKAAETCRSVWGLGLDVPITNMMRVAENAGAVVTRFAANAPKVDAFSRFGKRPSIVLNRDKQSSSRSVWDLAHECGHLVLHRDYLGDDKGREKEADRFAGALLLPEVAMRREFKSGEIDWAMVFDLKARWRTSGGALIERAAELGLIGPVQHQRAVKMIRARGWHRGEPQEREAEEPETIRIALQIMSERKGRSAEEVARALHWWPETLESVIGFDLPTPTPKNLAPVSQFETYRQRRA